MLVDQWIDDGARVLMGRVTVIGLECRAGFEVADEGEIGCAPSDGEVAPDLEAHLRELSEVLTQAGEREERNRRFLTAFVRPQGLDTPATPAFVAAVEQLARRPRSVDARFAGATAAQAFVGWVADRAHSRVGEWLLMDAIDDRRARSESDSGQRKREIQQRRALYYASKARARAEQARDRDHERRLKEWSKWRRGLSARKQLARLKGGLKQLVGSDHR